MASIHIKLRKSTVKNKLGSVYYQIIHRRKLVKLTTSIKLYQNEWDSERQCVNINDKNSLHLYSLQKTIDIEILILKDIIRRKEELLVPYSVKNIVSAFNSNDYAKDDFFMYMKGRIRKLEGENALGTAMNYQSAYHSFSSFISTPYLPFFALIDQDALLICRRDDEDRIKAVIENI